MVANSTKEAALLVASLCERMKSHMLLALWSVFSSSYCLYVACYGSSGPFIEHWRIFFVFSIIICSVISALSFNMLRDMRISLAELVDLEPSLRDVPAISKQIKGRQR